jgi:CheY-like chemotaxis protein/GAF domain-containing protein
VANILVVDDNAINRKLLVALLSGDGHLTHEACDGVDGLTAAHARRPQLIISDILMPTMDGYGFVRALRQDPILRGTPVIFYTAHYHEREAQNLAQACGVTRVLIKPCPNADILKAVEQVMAGVPETLPQVASADFDREHLRLVTNKLAERADALAASNARFAALAELNLEIASEANGQGLLEKACTGARKLLGSHYSVLAVAEESTRGLFFTTSGIDSGIPLIAPDLHAGALGGVLTQRKPWRTCRAQGTLEEPGFPLGYPSAKAYLAVPLMTPSRVYGWLCMGNKIGAECFDANDERLLQTLGAAVAKYYENNRLHTELQRQTSKLHRAYATLGGVNALIAQSRDLETASREACQLSVERGRYRLAYIEVAGANGGGATCIAAAGDRLDADRFAWRKPRDRSQRDDLVEAAVHTDAAAICNDLYATQLNIVQRRELLERGFRAIAVLPLSGNPSGRLVLLSEQAGVFDDSELRLLNEFAGGVALALAQVSEATSLAS